LDRLTLCGAFAMVDPMCTGTDKIDPYGLPVRRPIFR